ncbi:hypothetical protein, partial [Paramesorhizobium deserti]|uniref:hypothetical protein n=1 Tax=Paramesorhizobium deserti TaxID=1494590 RepID=UPI00129030FD
MREHLKRTLFASRQWTLAAATIVLFAGTPAAWACTEQCFQMDGCCIDSKCVIPCTYEYIDFDVTREPETPMTKVDMPFLRIPLKPAIDSETKPATHSD